MKQFFIVLIGFFSVQCLYAQLSINERLGYSPEDKLVIIHADDLAVSHSQNMGSFSSMKNGSVNSASIMMPCPWVSEVADFYKENPDTDFGLHLTLTNEWHLLRWGSVASSDKVQSLLNEQGFMYPNCLEFGKQAIAEEVEIELRAQIEKAYAIGLNPTHFDAHMGCLIFSSPEIFEIFLKLGREYKVPCMVGRFFLKAASEAFLAKVTDEDFIIERTYTAGPQDYDDGLAAYYEDLFRNKISSGLQILLIHPAVNNEELQAMAIDQEYWGASWRQQDLDFFTSEKCKKILEEENIMLVTWREVQKVHFKE